MNSEIEYLISSGAWSLGGLVVGYLLGRLERDVSGIKRRLDHLEEEHRDHA